STPVVAAIVDPGGAEPVGNYSATIDWGDGTTTPGTISPAPSIDPKAFTVTGTHAYADERSPTITVKINHESTNEQTVTDAVSTLDPTAAAVGIGPSLPDALPISSTQVVAAIVDPGGAEAVGNYSATIDWGDGTTTPGTVSPAPSIDPKAFTV